MYAYEGWREPNRVHIHRCTARLGAAERRCMPDPQPNDPLPRRRSMSRQRTNALRTMPDSALRAGPASRGMAWTRNREAPLRSFLRTERGSAAILLAAAIAALAWVNIDAGAYQRVWGTALTVHVGPPVSRRTSSTGSMTFASRVAQDVESADLSGVSGTPSFFVKVVGTTAPTTSTPLRAPCELLVSVPRSPSRPSQPYPAREHGLPCPDKAQHQTPR
jgi:hypothetical protein